MVFRFETVPSVRRSGEAAPPSAFSRRCCFGHDWAARCDVMTSACLTHVSLIIRLDSFGKFQQISIANLSGLDRWTASDISGSRAQGRLWFVRSPRRLCTAKISVGLWRWKSGHSSA
jgi:hypothetical protein